MRRGGPFQFEPMFRAFEVRRVLTVERVVTPKPAIVDDNNTAAILTWGSVGNVPEGVEQINEGSDLFIVGFNTRKAKEEWQQQGTPVTEEVALPPPNDDVFVKRVREIIFRTLLEASSDSNGVSSAGVTPAMAGLRSSIPASRVVTASYKTTWD